MENKIGIEFMRRTQPASLEPSSQSLGFPQPPLEVPCADNTPRVRLPDPKGVRIPQIDLRQAIEQRVSVRKYDQEPLSLEELSILLWLTQGVKEVTRRPATSRTVPSAGARHAFETYLLINRIDGLQPGLYRFLALEHALIEVNLSAGIAEELTQACYGQKMVSSAAVTFFWAAEMERMTWRYTQRGYRYIHLDAGHVCQNLYLAGEALDCGTCAIAAFDDETLNGLLGLDGEERFVVYLAALGKKEKKQ
jgi:SagB-type dehydrogenase family enzyme